MNWDISIGCLRQMTGRVLRVVGRRAAHRRLVLDGEAMEYAGRLQMRYGWLKHQAQWGGGMGEGALRPVPLQKETASRAESGSFSN